MSPQRAAHHRRQNTGAARVVAPFAAAVLVVGLGAVVTPSPAEALASTATTVVMPAPAATTPSAALPRSARAVGEVADWALAGAASVGEVAPEVGKVKAGSIALGIDAPVLKKRTTAASTKLSLLPDTDYTFEAYVRVASRTVKSTGLEFVIGGRTFVTPAVNAAWTRVSASFRTAADESAATMALKVTKAVRGLSVDAVAVYATDDTTKANLVSNGSFESVHAARGIVNSSLVMTTGTAAVAVAVPSGTTTWEAYRGSKLVATRSVTSKGALTALPLSGVSQGHYKLRVKASDGRTVSAIIAVIDSPNPWIFQDTRFGVGLHVESHTRYANAARYTRALGIAHARNDVTWARVEQKKGAYDFDVYDAPFAELAAQGVKVLAIADYGNPIYGAKNAYAPSTTAGLTAYGKYAAAVAKRYPLAGIEVFNEFNWPDHNKSNCRTATCYIKLVKAVSAHVGKVKPSLPIVVGATAKYPASWFDKLWKSGAIKYTDVTSFHPYEITGNPEGIGPIVTKARASMKKYAKTTKPIWITELGTSSATGNRTQTEQASILLRSAVTAFAKGTKKFYWYDLINDGTNAKERQHNFGLYSHPAKNVAAVAPKQSGFVQALTIAQLGGRSYRGAQNLGTGVVSQAFGSTKDSVSVVWTPKGTKTAKLKTSKSVVLVKFDGTKKTLKPKNGFVKFAVTKNPVFIRSGKATAGVTK